MGEHPSRTRSVFDPQILQQLPTELAAFLRNSSNSSAYLDQLAIAALDPHHTDRLFTLLEPIFVDIAARWLYLEHQTPIQVISAFARILPFAQYLRAVVDLYIRRPSRETNVPATIDFTSLDEEQTREVLHSLFRLMSFDLQSFSFVVSPIQLQVLFNHHNKVIAYLAIRCFSLYMHVADGAMRKLLGKYIGSEVVQGSWEDTIIDYRYLSLWEEKRWIELHKTLKSVRSRCDDSLVQEWIQQLHSILTANSVDIGGVLVPTVQSQSARQQSSLIKTPTVCANMHRLGISLLSNDPILLIGLPGSGKTSLINDAANELGQSSSMVTLILNEQTDSKSLLGVYSSSPQGGSFTWQPGVLTKAAREGRWVLIEDLDRAPAEVIGLLLPLIEKRELVIPSRKERFRCAEGFRVIATMRSSISAHGKEITPGISILGSRLWQKVSISSLPLEEVTDIIVRKLPLLGSRIRTIIRIYERINDLFQGSLARKSIQGRSPGLRDLIKFCLRIQRRLQQFGCKTGYESIPEGINDNIFLDAVDCFAAYLPIGTPKSATADIIAEELQISPQRMNFCLSEQTPQYRDTSNAFVIGRETCSKRKVLSRKLSSKNIFASTRPSLRTMEQVAAALQLAEPVLLVGETGIGKTAVIQQLAIFLQQKLTVINLSQQSESTDLLGGFKPVNIRTVAVPLVDEFNVLFESTFSAKKNQKFLASVSKSVSTSNWNRLVNILKEAVRMATGLFTPPEKAEGVSRESEKPSKRRRLEEPKYVALRQKWAAFAEELVEFEGRVAQGDSGFAFSFVPGKIVKALREGEWVLLDEINLASPDTLESISSLLQSGGDGSPSVLLSEAGDVERVVGHPNFRIFGAMNPATDTGKRDLAPGLRSRFTEIYVNSPDTDVDDLTGLIEAYLGPLITADQTILPALAQLYLETKKMNNENRLTDGAGQKPHFSIRTLVRTLIYVRDQAHIYGLRRAIYEGFCMSFLTLLSKDSEKLVLPMLDKYIFGTTKSTKTILSQTPKPPEDGKAYIRFRHYWMQQGSFQPEPEARYIITPFIERNLMNLVRASSTRRFPILLQGPTSSGKTSMVEYLAKTSGNRFVRINNHEHTDLQEYLGSYMTGQDGRLEYQEGVLVEALRNGYWIVLDELNLAPTDVLEALNRLLDDNRELFLPESQEVVRPHPNFMLFATQNPAGLYGGRKILSRAFRNRFLELHFDDIPEDELEYILKERSQIAPSFCTRIVAVYKRLSLLRQSSRLFEQRNSFATLRDLFRWALRKADDREQLAINGFMLLAERVRNSQEKAAVKKVIEEVMRLRIDEDSIYSAEEFGKRISQPFLSRPNSITWTRAMRRVFVLVSTALDNNEPVLLVGETGCGKTQICQAVAEAYGKQLHVINAHVNLETGDIIGSQRPVRNRLAIERQLMEDISSLLPQFYGPDQLQNLSSKDLLEKFSILTPEQLESIDNEFLSRIRQNYSKARSLFQWSNGSLITAMESGQYFLFDEISLADDSVLERLNSVLEPSRSILLAEKGPIDSFVTAKEGFQFLATMNPGGDYGKRELSAALRNRLTEIWVPQFSEAEDILPILKSKLHRSNANTPRAMLDFAKWFKERFQGSSGSMSIRDLLAWVNFINTCHCLDLSSAIVHGAALVFIDTLGANPSAMLAAASRSLVQDRIESLNKLSSFFGLDASSIYSTQVPISIGEHEMAIGPFTLELGSNSRRDPEFAFNAPTTVANTLRVVRGLQSTKPILLEGSPGVGKTTLVVTLAEVLGKPLTRINLSEQTDLTDLFGSDVPIEGGDIGAFAWSDAPFLRALQNGGWVLLDEMNLASQSVLEGLNSCLDHRQQVYIAELDQTFTRHPDFVLFAAQNPHHQGGGRKGLPASFVNRFTVVYADSFSNDDLLMICGKLSPNAPREEIELLVKLISALNDSITRDRRLGLIGGPWEINLRDILRWLRLLEGTPVRVSPSQFLDVVISQRFRTLEDRNLVSSKYAEIFSSPPEMKSYFHNMTRDVFQIGFGMLNRDPVMQSSPEFDTHIRRSDLPTMESLILCVRQSWPCILVGPSGCGKTTILRKLASINGSKIVDIPLNADTDTMDLIGGFEQADHRRHVISFLEDLSYIIQRHIIKQLAEERGTADIELFQLFEQATTECDISLILRFLGVLCDIGYSQYLSFYHQCSSLVELSKDAAKVGFEWTEGLFIQAIERGNWVVLDNANLCNSSVLDRLNSLMEPNGSLIINEQRTPDGSPREVKPHPNFRLFLTMDPRYGELSRAMRNRAIEICFIPGAQNDGFPAVITYSSESSIYRMRSFNLDISELNPQTGQDLYEVIADHFSVEDISSLDMSSSHSLRLWSSDENVRLVSQPTLQRYHSIVDKNYGVKSAESLFNPLIDEPRLVGYIQPSNRENLIRIAAFQDLEIGAKRFHQALVTVNDTATTKKPSAMNRLERSMVSKRIPSFTKESTHPLSAFLVDCCGTIEDILGQVKYGHGLEGEANIIVSILQLCWDIFALSQTSHLDEGLFQAYLQVAQSFQGSWKDSNFQLVKVFSRSLDSFKADWGLTTGMSMQRLWNRWRPATPDHSKQLSSLIDLQNLCSKFDQISLRTNLSFSELSRLRSSLLESQKAVLLGADATGLIQGLESAMHEVENNLIDVESASEPFLSAEFEALCQYRDFFKNPNDSFVAGTMQLLAGRDSRNSDTSNLDNPVPDILSKISSFSGFKSSHQQPFALKGSLSIAAAKKIATLGNVPLKAMDLLKAELETFSWGLTESSRFLLVDQKKLLQNQLGLIFRELLVSHEDLLDPESFSRSCSAIKQMQNPEYPFDLKLRNDLGSGFYFSEYVHKYLKDCFSSLSTSTTAGDQYLQVGRSCIQMAVTCLRLFVPNKPFDPCLDLVVQRERHENRVSEKVRKLDSLRLYESFFSGQMSTLRIRMVEDELKHLGESPPLPPVTRPQPSKLGELQGEFGNLLNAVLNSGLDSEGISSQQGELLRGNIKQIRLRLVDTFREYDDIVILVVRFLELLDLGIALMRLSFPTSRSVSGPVGIVNRVTPFINGGRSSLRQLDVSVPKMLRSDDVKSHVHALSVLAVFEKVDPNTLASPTQAAFHRQVLRDILDRLYIAWKERLSADQEKQAEKSKLYHYKGTLEDEEQADDSEFKRLFPTFEDESNDEEPEVQSSELQDVSEKLTRIFEVLFSETNKEIELQNTLLDATRLAGALTDDSHSGDPATHLSGLLLLLDEVQNPQPPSLYNFYLDPSLTEAKKLYSLVDRIRQRFVELRKAWPEHATLSDVLICCSEIAEFKHQEPVAKFITKAEKLHGFIYLWQLVASREFTAAPLYDELTSLLISWRRLELSTWARLLDIEKENCEKNASTWWFIAYEVAVQVPLQLVQKRESLSDYCEQLVSTLERFFASTPMGQFSSRLKLIDGFRKLLNIYCIDFPGLEQVVSSLANVYDHYSPFKTVVDKSLNDGRQNLEKEVREVIRLASWKDSNIAALRDSARRSHHRLFKFIRKYREIIGQPSEEIVSKELSDVSSPLKLYAIECPVANTAFVAEAIQLCRQKVPEFHTRPARLSNVEMTTKSMRGVYQNAVRSCPTTEEIRLFIGDVVDTINDFRKCTPSTLTEENKGEVQHLKIQKRRFYAEKLRALRFMGVKTSVGTDIFQAQSSASRILSSTPSLSSREKLPFDVSNDYFHRFIDLVPRARIASREYSEDLSSSEVGRSIGSIEALLYWITQQRDTVSVNIRGINSLVPVVDYMVCISNHYKALSVDQTAKANIEEMQSALWWMETMVSVSETLLGIHSKFSGSNFRKSSELLQSWRRHLRDVLQTSESLPALPSGISSTAHEMFYDAAVKLVSEIRRAIPEQADLYPDIAFIFNAMIPWTDFTRYPCQQSSFLQDSPVSDFDASLTTVMDKIFVALQRISVLSAVPISTETQGWLSKSDQTLIKVLAELHMTEVSGELDVVMGRIQECSPGSSDRLLVLASLISSVAPIVQQYYLVCTSLVEHYVSLNRETCKMAYILTKSFTQLASEGFCSPQEKSNDQNKSDKLEGGTGLGEGEGAEDISKDIQDDEDLTDLAQEKQKMDDEKKDDIEDTENAVNMDQEELEADGSDFEKDDEDDKGEESGDEEEQNVDDETGSVDDLDANAVDEKMWDGANDEEQKDTENNQNQGSADDDNKTAAANEQDEKKENADKKGEEAEDDQDEEAPEDEGEAVGREEQDVTEPQTKDEEILDLPEDMDLDQNYQEEKEESDDGMDEMSDMDEKGNAQEEEAEPPQDNPAGNEEAGGLEESEQNEEQEDGGQEQSQPEAEPEPGSDAGQDEAPEEDPNPEDQLQAEADNAATENPALSDAVSGGLGVDQDQNPEKGNSGEANQDAGSKDQEENAEPATGKANEGEDSKDVGTEAGGRDSDASDPSTQAFKKFGDILEEWHKRQKQIKAASEDQQVHNEPKQDTDMQNVDFEHLANEDDTADTQALGQANEEQARGLDERKGVEVDEKPEDEQVIQQEQDAEDGARENMLEDKMEIDQVAGASFSEGKTSFIADQSRTERGPAKDGGQTGEGEIEDVDAHLSAFHVTPELPPLMSADEAHRLWSHYESVTQDLSLSLTEQLRLILAPTLATKLRGDFRTGKRLNIKRIIPYIASQYKRDKIWMRRSIPSKRTYQIMLAVDDSKSMLESGSGQLAFETLALVARSLSMLEAGDLCVVSFGSEEHVRIAHQFGRPFSAEAGVQTFQQFSFQQTGTNVQRLLTDSIALFRDARRQRPAGSGGGGAAADLWQLQLIISDGICENHDSVRRLVRQAQEERIMIVFIILDAACGGGGGSIVDLTQARFEPDESGSGEMKLKMTRYLEGFPFAYYLVVRDIRELPAVLSLALKQWFAEVVDSSG